MTDDNNGTAVAIREESHEFWPWLAGFVDGEGSIGLAREADKRKGRDYCYYRPMLQIANCDKDALDLIHGMTGEGQIVHVAGRTPKHREQWRYTLRRRGALLDVLTKLRPHLIVKARQADLVMLFLRSREVTWARGWYKPTTEGNHNLYRQLREANARGPR